MTDRIGKGQDLIIVSFSFAPMLNPRAFRWAALSEEFARRGVRVHVVCSWQPGLAPREVLNGVEIHRVGNHFLERIRALLRRFRGSASGGGRDISIQKKGMFFGNAVGWIWRKLAWPDTTCVWYSAALREAKTLLAQSPNATLVSVSPTFTAALVCGAMSRQVNEVRWILDLGDPFSLAVESPPNNFWIYSALNRCVERVLFRRSSAVTLTNANVKQRYTDLYSDCKKKFFVIPPLLSEMVAIRPIQRKRVAIPGDPARIVYVGALYQYLRRPEFLLRLFSRLSVRGVSRHLELHFVGDIDECVEAFAPYANQIAQEIHLHGVVTREEAFSAIGDAVIVVNLGNRNKCQLPSKLIEYMALSKPILNILQTPEDPSLDLLERYRAKLTLFDSGADPSLEQIQLTEQFIDQAIRGFSSAGEEVSLEHFKVNSIANQYATLFFSDAV